MNKPFPQTPVLTDDKILEILKVAADTWFEGEKWHNAKAIAKAQARASGRNRDKQFLDALVWIDGVCKGDAQFYSAIKHLIKNLQEECDEQTG